MSLIDMLLSSAGGDTVRQIGNRLGVDDAKLRSVLGQVVPALAGGIQNNLGRNQGLESLRQALSGGNHGRYLEDPTALGDPSAIHEGNQILGHLLGSKDASRDVAGQASAATGVDAGVIKQLLPIVAAATMGALSKHTAGGAMLAPSTSAGGSGAALLSQLLGAGGGNALGTLFSLGKKLL
jgi:hypothetical protein